LQALKRHYEKVLLGALLLVLLVLSAHVLASLRTARQGIAGAGVADTGNRQAELLTGEDFQALQLLNNADVAWRTTRKTSLFVPDDYMLCLNPACSHWLPIAAEACPYCGTAQEVDAPPPLEEDRDEDGIHDSVEQKYAFLDPDDPRDAELDYDKDWFSNREEIEAGTDPADQSSHPPVAKLLRLVSIAREPFNMIFENLIVGGPDDPPEKWDVVLRVLEDGQWRTRFTKLEGEPVQGYRVVGIERRQQQVFSRELNETVVQDVSEITLENKENERVVLARNRPTYTGITVRFFLHTDPVNPRGGTALTATPAETLVLEDATGRTSSFTVRVRDADSVILTPAAADGQPAESLLVTKRPPRQPRRTRRTMSPTQPNFLPPEMMGMPPTWGMPAPR